MSNESWLFASMGSEANAVLVLWHEAVTTMPPIRNVALRDTLASLGEIKRRYDI